MSRPSKAMVPELGGMVPLIRLKKVVLPAPLGPMIACTVPLSMWVDTSLTADSPPKRLVRLRTSSMAAPRPGLAGARHDRVRGRRRCRCVVTHTPGLETTHDAVGHEDDQQDQDRAEDDEAVFLQELQVLGQPRHHQRAQQRSE